MTLTDLKISVCFYFQEAMTFQNGIVNAVGSVSNLGGYDISRAPFPLDTGAFPEIKMGTSLLSAKSWAHLPPVPPPVSCGYRDCFFSGTEQNLFYDMAGGKGKFLRRNLLAPYEIIAKKTLCPVILPIENVSAPYS